MTFKELHLIDPILKALQEEGYTHPTDIQQQALPMLLQGKDLLACAQTGTGKTAAFALPILQNLVLHTPETSRQATGIRTLVLTPTRELALQIAERFKTYGKYLDIRGTVIFGGVKQHLQVKALKRGVDVLVATPGRLLDLMGQGYISLDAIEYFVLDEADQMLDMGFIHDIKKVIARLPVERQSLFFSATMPHSITDLADRILNDPEQITIQPEQKTAERVDQSVYLVSKRDKLKLLIHLLQTQEAGSTLVFSRTKHGADKMVRKLGKAGIQAEAIHGNKSQNARQHTLARFKKGKVNVLVATDIAARGIDIKELELVVNYDLPNVPETYVHRIGRTGRAQASGRAISFCDQEERAYLKGIQKLIEQKISVVADHPFVEEQADSQPNPAPNPNGRKPASRNGKKRYYGKGKGRNQRKKFHTTSK